MNICILEHPRIRSEKRFNDIANTPLWSCLMGGYAAAALERAGHRVTYWDATGTRWDFARTKKEILALSPDLLCVNAVYFWEHTPTLFDMFRQLKEEGFNGHLNLFGFFPTLAWQPILDEAGAVDSVAVGEFEDTLVLLSERLQGGGGLDAIDGLAVRNGTTEPTVARPRPRDPNDFPVPARQPVKGDTVSILASRGCYNHCRFCPIPSFYHDGPLWRGRDPRQVYKEMRPLVDAGFDTFYFVDPNFIGPGKKGRQRTMELLDLIEPLGISFGMETRPNDLDAALLARLVAAGMDSLLLGIESGSPEVLGNLAKGATPSASERAIKLCREAGIEPEIGFLMFVPDSTVADLRHNLAFLHGNNLLDRLDRTANLVSHCQIVLRGTSGYARFREEGRLRPFGLFGFEGEVEFRDAKVAWLADLVVYASHLILREMERKESPIHWKPRKESPIHAAMNQALVDLFHRLLDEVEGMDTLSGEDRIRKEIESAFRAILEGRE